MRRGDRIRRAPTLATAAVGTLALAACCDEQPILRELPDLTGLSAGVVGTVWVDADADGVRQPGDLAFDGPFSVELTSLSLPDVKVPGGADTDGRYSVGTLPGRYALQFDFGEGVEPTAYLPGPPETVVGADRVEVELTEGEELTIDVRLVEVIEPSVLDAPAPDSPVVAADPLSGTSAIGDRYWKDSNNNGVQDAGDEPPGEMTGFEVVLLDEAGNVLATTVTDSGAYRFAGLPPGEYRVRFGRLDPERFAFVAPDGGDDAIDSDVDPATGEAVITLDAGETDVTVDAGVRFIG